MHEAWAMTIYSAVQSESQRQRVQGSETDLSVKEDVLSYLAERHAYNHLPGKESTHACMLRSGIFSHNGRGSPPQHHPNRYPESCFFSKTASAGSLINSIRGGCQNGSFTVRKWWFPQTRPNRRCQRKPFYEGETLICKQKKVSHRGGVWFLKGEEAKIQCPAKLLFQQIGEWRHIDQLD